MEFGGAGHKLEDGDDDELEDEDDDELEDGDDDMDVDGPGAPVVAAGAAASSSSASSSTVELTARNSLREANRQMYSSGNPACALVLQNAVDDKREAEASAQAPKKKKKLRSKKLFPPANLGNTGGTNESTTKGSLRESGSGELQGNVVCNNSCCERIMIITEVSCRGNPALARGS